MRLSQLRHDGRAPLARRDGQAQALSEVSDEISPETIGSIYFRHPDFCLIEITLPLRKLDKLDGLNMARTVHAALSSISTAGEHANAASLPNCSAVGPRGRASITAQSSTLIVIRMGQGV